ncbi:alpha/beta hydrolase [Paucibacter sp. APW11]|uniref:Alpha/beta hydrolase n=1 Tax=Roseateles aquae TaxID=3077235 RepID=A0ABU3PI80_9BURK|nr:alpha/beta hydrolase [Paucibacter sp. APW11]MDT9001822.1 alpha/beta hydrolase [Paucibacter sp. APW11]
MAETPFLQALRLPGVAAEAVLQVECQWLQPSAPRAAAPLIVFLHEGLGSLGQWRDFPQQLCEALGCRGLVYSRPGYGRSTALPGERDWPVDYLQRQAREQLPALFDALGLQQERLLLFGHSDGASLALLFAAAFPDRVAAVVAMAPHLFVEPLTLQGLREVRRAYEAPGSELREALARRHADADLAFYRWNEAWLRPDFEHWNIEAEVAAIRCPVLALQGVDDEYGTLAQIETIGKLCSRARVLALEQCGHSPQRDQPERVIALCHAFLEDCA